MKSYRRRQRTTELRAMMLAFWQSYAAEHGVPPTIRQAQATFGIKSTSTVVYHLHKLVDAGKLRRVPNAQHAYRLPRDKAA